MPSTIREQSNLELDAQWRITHKAWDIYWDAERFLNTVPRTDEFSSKRRSAVLDWVAARNTYRDQYRKLKRLMRVAIQYKRL